MRKREKPNIDPDLDCAFRLFFGFLLGVHMVEESSEKLTADSEMDIKSEWFWEEYSPVRRYIYNLALVVGGL